MVKSSSLCGKGKDRTSAPRYEANIRGAGAFTDENKIREGQESVKGISGNDGYHGERPRRMKRAKSYETMAAWG